MIIEKTNWQVVVVCYFMQIETQSRLNVVIKIVKGFIETLSNEKRPFDLFYLVRDCMQSEQIL